jgi:parvulin-like peptidyl-prolyl isomerase
LLSAQDPGFREAIVATGRGDRPEDAVRAQIEEQEPGRGKSASRPGEDGRRTAVRVAAVVNGDAILEEEVTASVGQQMASLAGLPEGERDAKAKEIYKTALNALVERELVLQEAKNKLGDRADKIMRKLQEYAEIEFKKTWLRPIMESNDFKSEEQLREALEKSGTSYKAVKYAWQRQFMATEYLRNVVITILDRIGHPDIEQYYRKHPDEFTVSDSLIWQDIFIDATRHPSREDAKRFAEALIQRVRNGEDFAKLAQTFDNGEAHLRKDAEGEGREHGKIRPTEVEAPLFRLKEKEMAPPIETPSGFHIVRVLERTYAGMKRFDEKVQKQIRDKLRSDMASKEMKKIVNDLKATAIIEYPK